MFARVVMVHAVVAVSFRKSAEAPPLILSEICLDPHFASTAVAESHAPQYSSSFPFLVFSLYSRLLGSFNPQSASFKLSIGTSLGPEIPSLICRWNLVSRTSSSSPMTPSKPVFANHGRSHLCYARPLTDPSFEQV
jgi:hypothetical protein